MVTVHEGTDREIALRLIMDSEGCSREYFDDYDTVEAMSEAASRLTILAMQQTGKDGLERVIGFAVVPHRSGDFHPAQDCGSAHRGAENN